MNHCERHKVRLVLILNFILPAHYMSTVVDVKKGSQNALVNEAQASLIGSLKTATIKGTSLEDLRQSWE
jgi:hypothetical protein